MPEILDTKTLKPLLRRPYAWPGMYEYIFLTSDGGLLCHKCIKEEFKSVVWSMKNKVNDGWRVVGYDIEVNYDDGDFCNCDHCNKSFTE